MKTSLAPRKLGVLLRPGAIFLGKLGLEPIKHFPRRAKDSLSASFDWALTQQSQGP